MTPDREKSAHALTPSSQDPGLPSVPSKIWDCVCVGVLGKAPKGEYKSNKPARILQYGGLEIALAIQR
jgi:hypothetical protein